MRSEHIAMTFEEFERREWRFGWKHEYWDGHAHITPRHNLVTVRAKIEPRDAACRPEGMNLREPCRTDEPALIEAFLDAFADGVEYCDQQLEQIAAAAQKNIRDFFAGVRGTPHSASRLAVAAADASQPATPIVGAALLATRSDGPVLDLLLVRPQWQRRGLATALVTAAITELHLAGEQSLRSAHHICNDGSAAWHQRFGFVEEPDLSLARLRRSYFQHELWRIKQIHGEDESDQSDQARLRAAYEHWQRQVELLEVVRQRDGFEAVTPVLRYD